MTILVTGVTGNVGRHVVAQLRRRDAPVRAFVRDRAKAIATLGPEVDLAIGDFGDPGSLSAACHGVEQVYLACANHPLQVEWETAAIDAAAAAGVRRIVKLAAIDAEIGSPVAFADAHGRIEEHLRTSDVVYVLLKPTFLMSNLLAAADGVRLANAIFLPAAGAKIAMIDPRDVAEVAAVTLTGRGQHARSYELTGPEAITFDDVAEQLSALLARPVDFTPVSDETAFEQLTQTGAPAWYASNLVTQFGLLRQGTQAHERDVVRVLTGREPHSVGEFLRDHAGAFA